MARENSLDELIDRAGIERVLVRYFTAVDFWDEELLGSCFTEDLEAYYAGDEPIRGRQGLVDFLAGRTDRNPIKAKDFAVSRHPLNNLVVRFDGDRATTRSYAMSYLLAQPDRPDGTGLLSTQALTYDDELVRTPGGWQICRRRITIDWTAWTRATPGAAPAPDALR